MNLKEVSEGAGLQAHLLTDRGDFVLHGGNVCIKHSRRQVPLAHLCVQNLRMSPGERLREIRSTKYPSASSAAEAMGLKQRFTYTQHENDTRPISRDAAVRYARFFKVSVDWLLTGRGKQDAIPKVPVVGRVGAGAEILPFDDFPQGEGIRQVDPPPGEDGTVALEIAGDSQYPLQEGWLIFYRRDIDGVPDECVGKLCVVKLTNGVTLLKTLRRGPRKGRFRLESWNAPPREDVQLEWASKVLDIRPS